MRRFPRDSRINANYSRTTNWGEGGEREDGRGGRRGGDRGTRRPSCNGERGNNPFRDLARTRGKNKQKGGEGEEGNIDRDSGTQWGTD